MNKKIFGIAVLLVALLVVPVYAASNVSIMYGWNGSTFVPLLTDSSGVLQSNLNLTESIGMSPVLNNTYDIGAAALLWANLYTRTIRSGGFLSIIGDANVTGTFYAAGIVANLENATGLTNVSLLYGVNGSNTDQQLPVRLTSDGRLDLQVNQANINTATSANSLSAGATGTDLTLSGNLIAANLNVTGAGNSTFSGDVRIFGTLYGGSPIKIAGLNVTDGNLFVTGALVVNSTTITGASASGWTISGSNVYNNTANVGIGTDSPTEKLTIAGNISFTSGSKIIADDGALKLQTGGGVNGSTGNGSIYFLDNTGAVRGRFDTSVNTTLYGTPYTNGTLNKGNGADGNVTITASKNINTQTIAPGRSYADGIAYRVVAPADGASSVTRYSGSVTLSNGIAAGDIVLLINMQGTTGDYADVGKYEVLNVDSVTASTITFLTAISKSYDGSSAANQKVVVQRIPRYKNVTITSTGVLTASAWDGLATTPTGAAGYYTGIVAFAANETVAIASGGIINVTAKGYRGGASGTYGTIAQSQGYSGESYGGTGTQTSSANLGGGGGGTCYYDNNYHGCPPGGSGAYATVGTSTTKSVLGTAGSNGGTYGVAALTTLFLGSGAGAGGADSYTSYHPGRIGGGIIMIIANSVSNSGLISARGEDKYLPQGTSPSYGCAIAAPGAGGSIMIVSNTVTQSGTVIATGGDGYANLASLDCTTTAGPGGDGRVRIEYNTSLTGSTSPAASTSTTINSTFWLWNQLVLGSYGTLYVGATSTSLADLAEYYATGELLEAGDVVSLSNEKLTLNGKEIVTKGVLRKSHNTYDKNLMGAISTNPGLVLGNDAYSGKSLLALTGRVPVKVSTENGPIDIGDYLTSSSQPGVAMRATQPGMVIGRALETFSVGTGKIEAFVSVTQADPNNYILTQLDALKTENILLRARIAALERK